MAANIVSFIVNNEASGPTVYALGDDKRLYKAVVGKNDRGEYVNPITGEISMQWQAIESVLQP